MLVFLALAGAVLALAPWKSILEKQIVSALETRGFPDVKLHVAGLGLKSIVLSDITFGTEDPLTLQNVKIDYSFAGLKSKRLEKLTISAPVFVLRQIDGKWIVVNFQNKPSVATAKPMNVETLTDMLQAIPFDQVVVEKGSMSVEADTWNLKLPLEAVFDRKRATISYKADTAHFRKGNIEAIINNLVADIHLTASTKAWKGNWQTDHIDLKGTPATPPTLKGSGKIDALGAAMVVDGVLQSDDKSYQMSFRYDHSFDSATKSVLTLPSAAMPWKEGALKLVDLKVPMGQAQPLRLNVQVNNVSIDELLGAMTGERVAGTGNVSGTIPVTIAKNGDLIFGQGNLKAAGPGTINMPPDAIPGDNEQIVLVRNILANLNYTALSITLNNDSQNNLGVTMSVEGSNPDVYNGRAVKLNVNLTGDVLDFIQQNVMLLTKPQTLWEDGANE